MKLLLVNNSFKGSYETFVKDHLYLIKNKYIITCLGHSTNGDYHDYIFSGVYKSFFKRFIFFIKKINLKILYKLKLSRNYYNLSLPNLAFSLKNDFDIIHCHFGNNGLLFAELKKSGLVTAKLITHFHGLDFTSPKYDKSYYEDLVKYGDINVVVTNYSKQKLLRLGFSDNKIKIIPVGIRDDQFKFRIPNPSSKLKLIFVGRFIELKGIHLFDKILSTILTKYDFEFVLTIVGNGPLQPIIDDLVITYPNNIRTTGKLNRAELIEELSNSDILIYPGVRDTDGREENQCVSIQEAGMVGLPVVAFNVGGVAESIINRETGFVIDNQDINEFCDMISLLSMNKINIIEMGVAARKFVSKKYSFDNYSRSLNNLYQI
ncbi:glycosyltransferase family 4 protein [Penaeicola halotolerans]|uniref:glycosyltransferase family 4 protein n=1 Tax=Penaeicola halotolerans TaxID=2793196 RepID=UPI001CF82C6D|nr:glycosyltransferase family 4 protein [Penaeicola halotolerans]